MAQSIDRQIFGDLYPSLRRFAAVVGDDDMEPDDLVQEVLASALRQGPLAQLDDAGAYLRTSIIHLVRANRRSAGRQRSKAPLISAALDDAHHDTDAFDLEGLLPNDPVDRALVWLTAIEGYPGAQAAPLVGLSHAAARKRLSRIRSRRAHDSGDPT